MSALKKIPKDNKHTKSIPNYNEEQSSREIDRITDCLLVLKYFFGEAR